MKLSHKLILSMSILLALMIVIGICSLYQLNSLNGNVIELGQERMPSNRLAQASSLIFSDSRIDIVYFTLTTHKEVEAARLRRYHDDIAKLDTTLAEFEKLHPTPEVERLYAEFKQKRSEYHNVVTNIISLVQKDQQQDAEVALDNSVTLYRACNDLLDNIVAANISTGNEAKLSAQETYDSARMLQFVILGISIIITIGIVIILTRNVMAQLGKDPGELAVIAERVVAGDYNIADGSPERGVYGDLVQMVAALKEHIEHARQESEHAKEQSQKANEAMLKAEEAQQAAQKRTEAMMSIAEKLEAVGEVVSSSSTELSAQIEQSDRSAVESAQRLSEAATAMNEMNATVHEVAQNASSASAASAETREKALAGADIVEKSLRSIENVHDLTMTLKDDMTQLNEHSQDISRIMNVISDIADQTNLLALNAAIEAARAGEAGRGFAVVADEVRKLAEKTMASTHDVGNAIKSIQDSTTKSMAGMDNAVELVSQTTQLASQSGAALQEIVNTVEATSDQVSAIAAASEEQSAASEEINHSIVQVNDMSRQTVEAMAEAAKAVSELNVQAHHLTDAIKELRSV